MAVRRSPRTEQSSRAAPRSTTAAAFVGHPCGPPNSVRRLAHGEQTHWTFCASLKRTGAQDTNSDTGYAGRAWPRGSTCCPGDLAATLWLRAGTSFTATVAVGGRRDHSL